MYLLLTEPCFLSLKNNIYRLEGPYHSSDTSQCCTLKLETDPDKGIIKCPLGIVFMYWWQKVLQVILQSYNTVIAVWHSQGADSEIQR